MNEYRVISKRTMLFGVVFLLFSCIIFFPVVNDYTDNFLSHIDELSQSDPVKAQEESLALLKLIYTIMAFVLFCFGIYFVYCGRKSIHSCFFPPPRSWIIEGRKILTGRSAQRAGRLQWITGYILISSALIIVVFAWLMLAAISGPPKM